MSRRLDVSPTAVHRLLTTLRAHGFVVQDSARAYRVGPALRELGYYADAERIESLKKRLRARTKIEVVRSALDRLPPGQGSVPFASWFAARSACEQTPVAGIIRPSGRSRNTFARAAWRGRFSVRR